MFLIPILSAILPIILPSVTKAVLPKLIIEAETTEASGEEKKKWVLKFFDDLEEIFAARGLLSPKILDTFDKMKPFLADMLEKQLSNLKAKGKL